MLSLADLCSVGKFELITGVVLVSGFCIFKYFTFQHKMEDEVTKPSGNELTESTELESECSSKDDVNRDNDSNQETRQENANRKLTTKEKFYLFLEKGFCPELEEDVEDPMYKYAGGAGREHLTDKNIDDATFGFCPFSQGLMTDGASDEEVDDEDENTARIKSDIDMLEKMMRADGKLEKNGFNPSEFDKRPLQSEAGSCPFHFGLKENPDSEEEADLPINHGKEGVCDMNRHTSPDAAVTTPNVKKTLEKIESSLTAEEIQAERAIKEEQISAIMSLLESQEGSLGVRSQSELQHQLKLYM